MADAPLSRRARRALEEQAAERAAQENLGSAAVPSGGVPVPGDRPLSRRDRRRLERLERPMETWTAEEEMIATGQIPVLTPERIAEQERLAVEKAAQAARDAELASHELRRVAPHEVAPRSEFSSPQHESVPTPEAGFAPAPEAGFVPTPEQGFTPTPEESFAPTPQQDFSPTPEREFEQFAVPEPAAQSEPEPTPAEPAPTEPTQAPAESGGYTPIFEFEPIKPPRAHEDAPPADGEVVVPTDSGTVPSVDARAQVFADLFPRGSVQAGTPPEPAVENEINPVDAPAAAPTNEFAPAPQHDAASGIDEIRRLAAEAMSGIERASHRGEAHASHAPESQVPEVQAPEVQWPEAQVPEAQASPLPTAAPGEPAVPVTPASGTFAQVSEQQPVTPASAVFAPVNAPEPEPAPEPIPQSAPNPWEAHPLEQAPVPQSDPNDFTPVEAPVQPDFSALYQAPPSQSTPFAPVTGTSPVVPPSGALPTSGQFPAAPFGAGVPTASGQIPTESVATGAYRRPEIPQGPGPRDFKWLHLGVIGALMFVLGVFIYNVAFNQ